MLYLKTIIFLLGLVSIKGVKNCIVGGGVSGVYTARMLLDRGHKDVVIFEASNRTGGKAKTFWHEDIPHSMGACYTTYTYNRVLSMADRYYIKNVLVGARSTNRDFLSWAVRNGYASSMLEASRLLSSAVQKWENVTGKISWKFPVTRPSNMSDLNMTLGQYFDANNIGILRAFTEYGVTHQGYEGAEVLPLFYALQWLTPSFMRLSAQSFAVLDYGTLFERMSKGMNVVYNTKVVGEKDIALKGCTRIFIATPTVVGSRYGVSFPVHTRRLTIDVSREYLNNSLFLDYNTLTGVGGSANKQIRQFMSRNDQFGWSPFLRPSGNFTDVTRLYESPVTVSEKDVDSYISSNSSIQRLHSNYFPRFSLRETVSGFPWKVWDIQGRNNIFYVGAHAAGFESVENIFKYVDALIMRFKL